MGAFQVIKKGAERVIIGVIERLIGRKEHENNMKASDYINKNFDDVWAAIIRLHVLLFIAALTSKKRNKQ